jgi:hypothetical protein
MCNNKLISLVESESIYSKEKSDSLGEVFTPTPLIKEMLSHLPRDVWKDSTKTWFDPCAGKGNFPAVIVTILMTGLEGEIPNKAERYKHIMEKQMYMAEYQRESAEVIERIFNPSGSLRLNLYVGDTLKIPDDFFDLPFEERKVRYPENCI